MIANPNVAPAADSATLIFPRGFRFGAATSAHQVEGGTANNWTLWEQAARPDGTPRVRPEDRWGVGPDHWNRFPADIQLMQRLGLETYRLSIEWSRVEPLEGHFDGSALSRYRWWCELLRQAGIEPMITLHHFTEPVWLTHKGGFESADGVDAWLRFVRRVVRELADLVDLWITINEPVGYALMGWWFGEWPPGRSDLAAATGVVENLATAHARAYHLIHDIDTHDADGDGRPCRVGIAHNIVAFRPRRRWIPLDHVAARVLDRAHNHAFLEALSSGRLNLSIPTLHRHHARDGRWRATLDFIGVNHYFPLDVSIARGHPGLIAADFGRGVIHSDLGWTMEPGSLRSAIELAAGYRLPIIVTEHGACDGDVPDARRRTFLLESLAVLRDTVRAGAPVEAYLHWSLLDNFEWTHGYAARFGLFAVNRGTGERTMTSAGEAYRDVVTANRAACGR